MKVPQPTVMRCDRCKKERKMQRNGSTDFPPKGWVELSGRVQGTNDTGEGLKIGCDMCDECAKEFDNWFNEGRKNHGYP